jgi:4-amino-4-deoxy-L-arabinose transferase-like glycosyltransferase
VSLAPADRPDNDPAAPSSALSAATRRWPTTLQVGLLACMVAVYLALAIGWNLATPPFDNPDEPAQWNYVRFVADTARLPVLRVGDDPQQLVDRLKTARFPAGQSIDTIRYESHQPPLYYVGAAVVYKLTAALALKRHVEAVRLLSTLCGLLTIVVAWAIARAALPGEPALALAAAGFVAFVPMHVNMTAAVENDALSNLLLAVSMLGLLLWLQHGFAWRGAIVLGLVMGLAALAKVTALVVLPLALLAALLRYRRAGSESRHAHPVIALIIAYAVTLLVWGWWVVRNMLIYGMHDPLALDINRLVVPQPLTGPLNAAAANRFFTISFDSFWAQFGWMGIPVPRVYPALILLSVLAALGLVVALFRALRPAAGSDGESHVGGDLLLVLAWPVLVFLSDAQYNLTFIQAQGRYLFPGIGGIALFFMLGLSRLAGPRLSGAAVGAAVVLLATLSAVLLKTVVIPAWR